MTEKTAPPSETPKKESLFDTATELFEKTIDKLSQNISFRDGLTRSYLHPESIHISGVPFEGKDGKYAVTVGYSGDGKYIELEAREQDGLTTKENFYLCLGTRGYRAGKYVVISHNNRFKEKLAYNEEAVYKFSELLEKI